jgi:hypothetical protein
VLRAPQPCQEIPVEQMSGRALARMRPDLSIGATLPPPGGNVGVRRVRAQRQARSHSVFSAAKDASSAEPLWMDGEIIPDPDQRG